MKALTKQDDLILITKHLSHVASIFASNKIQRFYEDKSLMTVYCHFTYTENGTSIWSPNISTFNPAIVPVLRCLWSTLFVWVIVITHSKASCVHLT